MKPGADDACRSQLEVSLVADSQTPPDSVPGPTSDPTLTSPPTSQDGPADAPPVTEDTAGGDAPSADRPFALRRPSVSLPEQTGRYVIRGEIAHGGMGAVLLGHDRDMGRELAIKVLRDDYRARPERVRRFLTEARVNGRLQHPGIVPVYELGRFGDDRPYFTMKLVAGRTLAALLAERKDLKQDLPRFLAVFEQVCQAMAYAHSHRVIHRDLKPANIMVGAFGEVQVMDWGLAKVLGGPAEADAAPGPPAGAAAPASGSEATVAGSVLGTFAYMPPEQARGEIDRLDERADVFGLGALLCEILTGRPPYVGGPATVAARATAGDLAEAHGRLAGCGADPELLRLARACLAAEPKDRPRDAGAVAGAVTAYLAGVQERLRAAEIERAAAQGREADARAKAAAERRARRVTVALAVALVLLAGLAAGGWLWRQQERTAASAAVHDALATAQRQREKARGLGEDLVAWAEAVAAARQALALAAAGRADPLLGRQAERLLAEVQAEEEQAQRRAELARKDGEMLAALDRISQQVSRPRSGDAARFRAGARGYREAFRRYGLDVERLPVKEAASRIKERPERVRLALTTALDDWAYCEFSAVWEPAILGLRQGEAPHLLKLLPAVLRQAQAGQARTLLHLTAVAQEADSEPFRRQLRDALRHFDLVRFNGLADDDRAADLPGPTLNVLAKYLRNSRQYDRALRLLRKAHGRARAGDFWVNFDLALVCHSRRPPALDEAACYATAAVSLRPDSAAAWYLLASILLDKGDRERARAALDQFNRLDAAEKAAHATARNKK
jgi:serine/threonine-protein kinase